jgi:cell wall-associated NlpC family hydrolase
MVGTDTRLNITSKDFDKYRGVKFLYGGYSLEQGGLDCMGFIYAFYKGLGVNMPDSLSDKDYTLTETNYAELNKLGSGAIDFYTNKYFDLFGEEIDITKILLGDAILFKHNKFTVLCPAIYGGNNIAIACFLKVGVKVISVGKDINVPIIRARRINTIKDMI